LPQKIAEKAKGEPKAKGGKQRLQPRINTDLTRMGSMRQFSVGRWQW